MLLPLSLVLHLYVAARLIPALADWRALAVALGGVLLVSAFLLPQALRGRRAASERRRRMLAWTGMTAMGWFSSLLVFTLLRDVALLAASLLGAVAPSGGWAGAWSGAWFGGSVDSLLRPSALAVLGLACFASGVGAWNARRTARVLRVDVPIRGLPAALVGFTIAQISDIHVGPTIRAGYVGAIVARVNALRADMVAVTGDLVDGSVAELAEHVAPLGDLRARHGSFFCTGNHEYYSGAAAWTAELRRLGLQVLLNQHVVLDHDGDRLVVAGVTDHDDAHHFDAARRSDPHGALQGAPADIALRLLLAHQPRSAAAAADAGYQLQLSGHTHGGQFWPWTLFVRLQQPYTAGLHRLNDLWVYVSRGTGYWGPPKRFGAPSEITLLRLVTA